MPDPTPARTPGRASVLRVGSIVAVPTMFADAMVDTIDEVEGRVTVTLPLVTLDAEGRLSHHVTVPLAVAEAYLVRR